jgi:hypothetical protein
VTSEFYSFTIDRYLNREENLEEEKRRFASPTGKRDLQGVTMSSPVAPDSQDRLIGQRFLVRLTTALPVTFLALASPVSA